MKYDFEDDKEANIIFSKMQKFLKKSYVKNQKEEKICVVMYIDLELYVEATFIYFKKGKYIKNEELEFDDMDKMMDFIISVNGDFMPMMITGDGL